MGVLCGWVGVCEWCVVLGVCVCEVFVLCLLDELCVGVCVYMCVGCWCVCVV